MQTNLAEPDYDVVIVGSGIAGALAAYKLAQSQVRVLVLEAGGVPSESLGRYALVHSFIESPSKATDAPFCGDNILATQPDPRAPTLGTNYYDYPAGYTGDKFVSYYERLVGGSTWHWQGIYVRMVPSDFKMSKYKIGDSWPSKDILPSTLDWPLSYDDLEPWYVD